MQLAVLMYAMQLVTSSGGVATRLKSITSRALRHRRDPVRLRVTMALILFAVGLISVPTITKAQSFCESCEAQLGLGGTYHFWGPTGGLVFAGTLDWDSNRYELGVFRIASVQVLRDRAYDEGHIMADPYWGASLSRRWQLFEKGPVKGFVGLGMALKTESDQLSATRWDFAEQAGLRFRIPGQIALGELTVRHWSNAGIRLPNHGQDFVTLTIRLNTGRFGVDTADRIALDEAFQSRSTLLARNLDADGSLP
jgi:hypothetical protein